VIAGEDLVDKKQ